MEQTDAFFERLNKNKTYAGITGFLFPVILVVFAFIKVNKGLDITDSAFNPYNYLHTGSLNDTWFYSYFLTNMLGAFFGILPMGKTMLGMNIYTGLVKLILALLSYFFFTKRIGFRREYVFIGVLTALGLCWCPTTVMYNYLTYLLFFAGTAMLYTGLVKDDVKRLFIAGLLLGLNLFVRFPNLCEAGLIVAVWFYSFLQKETLRDCLKKTGICILGYVIALVIGFVAIAFTPNGIGGFFEGIKGLFAMTKEATGYAPTGMIRGIVDVYVWFWTYTETTILMLLMCTLVSLMLPHKLNWVRYFAVSVITLVLIFMLYRKGMFSFDYSSYGPIYGTGVLVTEITLLFSIFCLIAKIEKEDKLLAMICILTVLITPLGTNNALYANINYGFFTLPVLIALLFRQKHINPYFKTVNYALLLLTLLLTVQSVIFGARFVFRDGDKQPMNTKVLGPAAVGAMKTTADHASELNGLFKYFSDKSNVPGDAGILQYGDVSGLAFYLQREVATGFAWPSLDSYPIESFQNDLNELESKGETPVVIVGIRDYEQMNSDELTPKQIILKEFLGNNHYEIGYYSERLVVLTASRNGEN
ncbi:MAG: hypothetical protein K6E19_03550 [Lachnospiraceae bacterium]|nr:hypothetical protein [Lachnospiraceae bacterium]